MSAGAAAVAVADNAGNQVEVYDAQGAFQSSVGAGGLLRAPLGVAFDSSGNIYVANTQESKVVQFGASGNLLDQFEALSNGPPQWVATSSQGLVYGIAQSPAVWITPGLYVLGVGLVSTATGPAPVEIGPTGIAVDSVGDAYVGDATTNSVLQFDSSGRLLTSFGGGGSAPGQFTSPAPGGVAIDSADNLYVVDNTGGPKRPGASRSSRWRRPRPRSSPPDRASSVCSAVTARLRCRARGAGRCTGTLQVRRRRVTIGERPFSIAAGAVGSVRVSLPAWARRVLRLGRSSRSISRPTPNRRGAPSPPRSPGRGAAATALSRTRLRGSHFAALYRRSMTLWTQPEVWPQRGQQGPPPGALMPISMCSALEIPTRPQPTWAIGWPRETCAPTRTSAGWEWP